MYAAEGIEIDEVVFRDYSGVIELLAGNAPRPRVQSPPPSLAHRLVATLCAPPSYSTCTMPPPPLSQASQRGP